VRPIDCAVWFRIWLAGSSDSFLLLNRLISVITDHRINLQYAEGFAKCMTLILWIQEKKINGVASTFVVIDTVHWLSNESGPDSDSISSL
jgi:hypothetical protein